MISTPKIEQRSEQAYMAIRIKVAMQEIPAKLPPLIPQVHAWLEKNNATPDGPPFFQYLTMEGNVELVAEVGFPVRQPMKGDGHVVPGFFPAGRYATLTYMGDYMGLPKANMALDKWVKEQGLKEQHRTEADGTKTGTRTELYMTDPQREPDREKWRTDVLVLLA